MIDRLSSRLAIAGVEPLHDPSVVPLATTHEKWDSSPGELTGQGHGDMVSRLSCQHRIERYLHAVHTQSMQRNAILKNCHARHARSVCWIDGRFDSIDDQEITYAFTSWMRACRSASP